MVKALAETFTEQELDKVVRFETTISKNEWLLNNSKIGFFDIETTNLEASIGVILCACIKERGGPTATFVTGTKADDTKLVVKVKKELEKYDYIATWYGTGFDIPFINTRLLIAGADPINRLRHLDLYYHARGKLKLHSNRLAVASEVLLGVDDKTRVLGPIWTKAAAGDKEAMRYIVEHCEIDVDVTERVFEKIKGFINFGATRWRVWGASY